MPLSAADLAFVRSKIGLATPPIDADLHASYDLLGSPEAVAAEVLDARLAALLWDANGNPLPPKRSLDGDLAVDFTALITALRSSIDDLRSTVDETAVASAPGIPWAGGITWSERDTRDPDLVAPYFSEDMAGLVSIDPRSC